MTSEKPTQGKKEKQPPEPEKVDGTKGLKRLEDLTRHVLKAPKGRKPDR